MEEGFILVYDFRGLSGWPAPLLWSLVWQNRVAHLTAFRKQRENECVTGLLPTPPLSHLAPGLLAAAAHGRAGLFS